MCSPDANRGILGIELLTGVRDNADPDSFGGRDSKSEAVKTWKEYENITYYETLNGDLFIYVCLRRKRVALFILMCSKIRLTPAWQKTLDKFY